MVSVALTVIDSDLAAVPIPSLTWTVKLEVPAAVGVPLITPDEPSSASPPGSDPLPTNCCSAWFCTGSHEPGYNLGVFFYGCSFDCLFCQNWTHRERVWDRKKDQP
jgi:hypothetical protein